MPFPDCVPELTDSVVLLRAHRPADVEGIVAQSTDADSVAWTTVPRPYGPAQAREFLRLIETGWNEQDGHRHWVICEAADPSTYLGTIDLRPKPGGTAEVGFGLAPAGRGRGVMIRAVRLLARHYFDELGGRRLYWYADRGNFASWRVAWACGFTHHGLLPLHNAGLAGADGRPARDAWVASVGARDDLSTPLTLWTEAPVLEGAGLRLRPWRDTDTAVAEPHDHPAHFVPDHGLPTADTFADWLLRRSEFAARGQSVSWCIADRATDEPFGEIAIFVRDGSLTPGGTAEVGYFVRPSARGRGIAERAARLASDWALTANADTGPRQRRLVATTASDNVASSLVLARSGFTQWGHERAATAPDGSVGPADHWERVGGARRA